VIHPMSRFGTGWAMAIVSFFNFLSFPSWFMSLGILGARLYDFGTISISLRIRATHCWWGRNDTLGYGLEVHGRLLYFWPTGKLPACVSQGRRARAATKSNCFALSSNGTSLTAVFQLQCKTSN
jgi:hypothetical protein